MLLVGLSVLVDNTSSHKVVKAWKLTFLSSIFSKSLVQDGFIVATDFEDVVDHPSNLFARVQLCTNLWSPRWIIQAICLVASGRFSDWDLPSAVVTCFLKFLPRFSWVRLRPILIFQSEMQMWVILAYMCVKLQMRLHVCHRVGPFLVHFWSIAGPFLGPFWVHFGSILGPFWVHLGSKNRYLGKNQHLHKNRYSDKNRWIRQECSLDKNSTLDC